MSFNLAFSYNNTFCLKDFCVFIFVFFSLYPVYNISQRFSVACFCSQVIGIAVIFALLLKPVAMEETEEIEQVLLGKKNIMQPIC